MIAEANMGLTMLAGTYNAATKANSVKIHPKSDGFESTTFPPKVQRISFAKGFEELT